MAGADEAGVDDAGRAGLSRRQMIKASAVAGAAAWSAPVIIDSLASPAAAISGGINLSVPSYALIVFDKGGQRFVLKITKTACGNTNDFSGDVPNLTVGACGGTTFGIHAAADLYAVSGTPFTTYTGSDCSFLFTASGNIVTADPSITLILGVGHQGSTGCTNIPGGGTDIKLVIDCAPLNDNLGTNQVQVGGPCPVDA